MVVTDPNMAALSAFKPFCPAHIVLRNMFDLLYILSNK